ncbi:MAG TPA: MFS transporter [Nocardioidaceae bacterium]|nr:MFS transporter [Nocardioidaceae bacterium]
MTRPNWPRLDRSRFALVAGLAIDNYGSGLFLPLALVYATRVVDLAVDTAGTVVAAASVLGFAVPPIAGRLTHRLGPRAVVVTSQLLQASGALAYLLAGDAVGVFVAAALLAAGTQLFYCSVFVLVADVSTDTAKERPFALIQMVRAGSFGLGTLTGALLLSWGSDTALRWLVGLDAATFVVAAVLLATLVTTEPVDHETAHRVGPLTVLRDRPYLALMAAVCLVDLADFALVGMPIFVIEVVDGPAWLPGALLATGTAMVSLGGVRVVDALRGVRRTRSMQSAAATYAVWGILMMAMLWIPAGWLIPYAFAIGVLRVAAGLAFFPIAGALSEALPPTQRRAGYMSTYQYAFTTAQAVAPAVVALFAVASWLPWAVVAACSLAATAVIGWLGRTIPATSNRAAAPVTVA